MKFKKIFSCAFSELQKVTKRVPGLLYITMFFLCSLLPEIQAQVPFPEQDTLNAYQTLIQDLESRGISVVQVLENQELVGKLKDFDLNVDSLRHYYNLKNRSEGRDTVAVDRGQVAILGKSYGDSIVLRWAPSDIDLWDGVKENGYYLVRMTVLEKEEGSENIFPEIDLASRVVLSDSLNPLLPWTLQHISEVVQPTDTMAMIAAQAMYGSAFSSNMSIDSLDFVDRYNEKLLRFGFSLLMADRSVLAAEIMGLRYVDTTMEKGKTYVYGIYPIGEEVELGNITFIANDPSQNKKVEGLTTEEGDGKIKLFWPKHNNQFSGYWIERSADSGQSWQKLTNEPLVFVEQGNNRVSQVSFNDSTNVKDLELNSEDFYIYIDSVSNYVPYKYRVSGQTPFADYSDYAFTTGMAGDQTPPPMPIIITNEVDEESDIASLVWEMDYPPVLLKDLAGFTVWEAEHPDSTFMQISGLLPPNSRTYQSPQPLAKNRGHYYLLKAVDKNGNAMSTYPLYMHVVDDIPPVPPMEPAYLINDSTGVVTLVWRANQEIDLAGYRVYFANSLQSEFSQLTNAPINENIYYDTIALVTLTEQIYYRIQAVDRSHNRSDFSEVVVVKRPDYVPPTTPVMEHPDISAESIQLNWRPSNSRDVEKHILYRRPHKSEEEWLVLQEFEGVSPTSFKDTTTTIERTYEYTIRALDDAGLYSDYSFVVKGQRWFDGEVLTIQDLQMVYDSTAQKVELSWGFEPPKDELFEGVDYLFYIYRSVGDAPVLRYRILDSQSRSFSDSKTKGDGPYNYSMKVYFMNGKASPLSEPKSVIVTGDNDD